MRDAGLEQGLDLLAAPPEDERVAALQPDDGTPAPAVVHEHFVDLGLRQRVPRDARRARGARDELGRDEPVVDEHLARLDELQATHRDQPRVAGPGADDRNAQRSSSATTCWK